MEDTVNFINNVIAEYNDQIKYQPYEINLLEEAHMHDEDSSNEVIRINENVHSRILRSLLAYNRSNGEYVLLKGFIEYIASLYPDSSWKNIHIIHPNEPETENATYDGRIDLFIEEPDKYAIIVENKINLTEQGDQPNQLARYILHKKRCGYQEEQIYIVYLTSDGHEPSIQSWMDPDNDNNCFRERFQSRYANLSYKKHLLDWLRNRATPLVDKLDGEKLLSSALLQYVNYLEKKYKQRRIDLMINEDLKKALGFTDEKDLGEKLSVARSKLDSVMTVKKGITDIIKELVCSRYPQLHIVDDNRYNIRRSNVEVAFSFCYNQSTFYVALYKYDGGNSLYCGVFAERNGTISDELRNCFEFLTPDKNNDLYCRNPLSGYSDIMIDRVLSKANEIAER